MGKVLKPILLVAAVAVNAFPVVGQVVSGAILAATGVGVGAAAALAATSAVLGVAGSAIKTGARAGSSLSGFDPKAINVDPAAKRKMVFGRTAFPLDLRYAEPSGTNQEFIDYIFALAAHRSDGIEEIYIEDKLAWTLAGGAQGIYAGFLTVEIILEGGAAAFHTVNAGATWGSAQRMTGCTTMKVRVKRSNTGSTASPFVNGIAGRWTVIGRGMPLYDPALDSTVPGGSGAQRANDCTTWRWSVASVERGRNPALQLLAYMLGYRINGVVSVGLGMAAGLIDMPSFAAAAARCDEAVTVVVGGSHRRYEAGRFFADDDDPEGVIATLLAAMNAELTDDGGRLGLRVAVNDLTAAITLTDDDIQNGFSWNPAPSPAEQFTLVRGRFQQPNAPSLFGLADYPDVTIPRTSPAPRTLLLDLSAVQDVRRAERIAKQVGQRSLYVGTFSTRIGIRGWFLRRNMIVAWSSEARGWSNKLFRVRSLRFNIDGTVDCVFREENAAVYQWDNDETGNVSPVTPTTYDPRNAPWITAVATAATTADWPAITGIGKPDNGATASDNLISNAGLDVDATSWVLSSGTNRQAGSIGEPAPASLVFQPGGIERSAIANNNVRRPLPSVGRPVFVRAWSLRGVGTSGRFDIEVLWFRADGSACSPAFTATSIAPTVDGLNTLNEFILTPPSDAVQFLARFVCVPVTSFYAGSGLRIAATQAGADVTAQSVPLLTMPAAPVIRADFTGAVLAGQLPRTAKATRTLGGTDVSSSTSWSVAATGCTATINSTGLVSITAVSSTGRIVVTSMRDGLSLVDEFAVIKENGAPPATGGAGATSASDSSIASITANTYGGEQAGPLTVTAGSGGTVTLSAPLSFSSAAAVSTRGKWRWRIVGGSYADVAAEISSSSAAVAGEPDTGYIEVSQSQTGLSPGSAYEFILQLRRASGSGTVDFSGTASAVAS